MARRTLSLVFDPIRSPPLTLGGVRRYMSPEGDTLKCPCVTGRIQWRRGGEGGSSLDAGTALKKGPSPVVTIGAPDAGLRGVDSGAGDMSGGRQGERLDAHSTRTHHRRTVGYTNRKICERRGY